MMGENGQVHGMRSTFWSVQFCAVLVGVDVECTYIYNTNSRILRLPITDLEPSENACSHHR